MKRKRNKLPPFAVDPRMEGFIKNVAETYVWPMEQRLNLLLGQVENVKANQITLGTILQKHGLIDEEEYKSEYGILQATALGLVSADGTMDGRPIFSLYNLEEVK